MFGEFVTNGSGRFTVSGGSSNAVLATLCCTDAALLRVWQWVAADGRGTGVRRVARSV